ncbi:aspartic peptidase domain-containing protein [Mycena maculata]|uniref:Aspartic peptidase domain-containing protein n=1 Tax=Mycena maculata TaxID=230809 RepID=A0AAD7NE67_9AGAR|nr:aspartic peptidase domain-containing protein [Mycena maculata]
MLCCRPPRLQPVLAGLALAGAVAAEQAGFSLPITRVLAQKPPGLLRLGQTVNTIPLTSSHDYGECFSFCFDTGSADLWVVSDCHDEDCINVPQYVPSDSPTLTQTETPFKLDYLSGDVDGVLAFDTVKMGEYQVLNQIFGMVYQTSQLGLTSTATSGILGFCFPATAAIPGNAGATLLENVLSPFDPPNRFFAFSLSRDPDANASFSIGTLIPECDPALLVRSLVVRTGADYDYWKLPFWGMTVNGQPFQISSSRVPGAHTPIAVCDSGTTLLLGPTADVDAIYALFGSAARNDPTNGYQLRCTFGPLISVVLGDDPTEYPLHPLDIAWGEGADDGWCTGGIQANDNVNSGDWLFGDVFLRNVCIVHYTDPPAIALCNRTDPDAALAEFRAERGPDILPRTLNFLKS